MPANKSEILQGTLDLMVLRALDAMRPLRGYGIARRIEQISEEALQINQGTIYASLVRPMQKRWIAGRLGASDLTKTSRSIL
jgi:PadR family transcriptional regulator PadR